MSDCVDRVSMKSETLYNNAKHRGEKECINVHEDPVTFLSFVKAMGKAYSHPHSCILDTSSASVERIKRTLRSVQHRLKSIGTSTQSLIVDMCCMNERNSLHANRSH